MFVGTPYTIDRGQIISIRAPKGFHLCATPPVFFFVTDTVVKGRAQRKSSEARLTLFVKVKKFAGNGEKRNQTKKGLPRKYS